MTTKQRADIECVKFFIPHWCDYGIVSEDDEKKFLEYSERGKHKADVDGFKFDGFNALVQGKRWRGVHIHELWKPDLNITLFIEELEDSLPPVVFEHVKKE